MTIGRKENTNTKVGNKQWEKNLGFNPEIMFTVTNEKNKCVNCDTETKMRTFHSDQSGTLNRGFLASVMNLGNQKAHPQFVLLICCIEFVDSCKDFLATVSDSVAAATSFLAALSLFLAAVSEF